LAAESDKKVIWTRSKYYAILLLIILIIFFFAISLSIRDWSNANNNLKQPRIFHISFGADYDDSPINATAGYYDIEIDLKLTYPENTLVVGDIVTVEGIAVVHSYPSNLGIYTIKMGFENSVAFPTAETNNITTPFNVDLLRVAGTNQYSGSAKQCLWQVEGTYHPLLVLLFDNSTHIISSRQGLCTNMAITVYPKSETLQILTNEATMTLTIALFALTIVGTLSLFITLWDRNIVEQGSAQGSNQGDAQTQNNNKEAKTEIEQHKDKTEQTNKQTQNDKK
jgi:hypothetical protein